MKLTRLVLALIVTAMSLTTSVLLTLIVFSAAGGTELHPRGHGAMSFDEEDEGRAFWIKNEPDEHGTYHVYLDLGEDDVNPQGPGYAREARAHTRSDQPHKQPEDEAVVEQILGTLATHQGHFGPRDASIYAASLLEMARGRRGITPAKLVEYLNLCPAGGWHFTEECDALHGGGTAGPDPSRDA